MTESDRRIAKAQMRQAEAIVELAVRIAVAGRSTVVALPRRLKQLSARAR